MINAIIKVQRSHGKVAFVSLKVIRKPFSENKKFEQLCERHNLKLEIKVGADKKNRYTVRKEELGDAV